MANTFGITLLPLDGWGYVDKTNSGGALGPGNASGTLPANLNDQILYELVDSTGGTVTVNSDGDYTCNAGASFNYRIYNNSANTWGTEQTEVTTALSLAADAGTAVITGAQATFTVGVPGDFTLPADAGVYAVTGVQATLTVGTPGAITLPAEAGTVTITGAQATLAADFLFSADGGTVTVTGADATLVFEQPGVITMPANAGAYGITGADTALNTQRALIADTGTVTITGQDAATERHITLSADAGTYAVAGRDVNFSISQPGENKLVAESGAVVLSGADVTFIYEPEGSRKCRLMTAVADDRLSYNSMDNRLMVIPPCEAA